MPVWHVCIRDSLFVSFCSIVFSKSLTHQYQFFIWTRTDLKRKKWIQTALEILNTRPQTFSGNRNSNSGIVYSKIRRGDRKIMCVCTVTMVSNFSFPRDQQRSYIFTWLATQWTDGTNIESYYQFYEVHETRDQCSGMTWGIIDIMKDRRTIQKWLRLKNFHKSFLVIIYVTTTDIKMIHQLIFL